MLLAHVPDQRRTKLDDKSKKLIFIGYDEKSKAYKLFDPTTKRTIVSRDVEVNEEVGWDWKNQCEEELTEGGLKRAPREHEASSSSSSGGDTDSESSDREIPRNQRFRSIEDLYESTGEVHLVCLLADAEQIPFEEAVRDTK